MLTETTTQPDHDDNGFQVKTANEWLFEAKKKTIPRQLFGEFWLEGELAIMFADTGMGKSVLAVQIAESIAGRRHVEPLRMGADAQTVVYLDLEMSDKQFEGRYSADHAGGRARFLHNHYSFSDNFHRVQVDLADAPAENEAFTEYFVRRSAQIVAEKQATVLIIDNITFLKRTYYGTRETLLLMKALDRLKKRHNLSILVVAHSRSREASHVIGINDLPESRLWGRYADTIFTIGQSRLSAAGRYIKQIKQRSNMLVYDASHVPTFRLKKLGGNFLGFEYDCFAPEIELLDDIRNQREWETIEKIKAASDAGTTIRAIATDIGLSKTTVHRLLKMWRPPVQSTPPHKGGVAVALTDAVVLSEFDPKQSADYFPGCEEFDAAERDPKFETVYETEDDEDYAVRREYWLLGEARRRAEEIYDKCGKAPTLAETLAMIEREDNDASDPVELPAEANQSGEAAGSVAGQDGETVGATDPETPRLKSVINAYGREILVEKMDSSGEPEIWYSRDSKGNKMRHERKSSTNIIIISRVDGTG